jgi:muramoyltetrapeptide carboxypeptidase LdcA involved in peptidoglycan recycling
MLAQARRVLMEPAAAGALPEAAEWYATQLPPGGSGPTMRARPGGARVLRPGVARGRLVATLPSVLLTLVELGLAPSLEGAIWCLDSYRTPPARVAEQLAALGARGALDGLAGLVLARPWPSSAAPEGPSLDEVVLRATARMGPGPPTLADADTGHTWPKWTLPNGVLVELDSAAGRLTLLEPAVA